MGGWSRVPPLSPLTITEIGFSGPFFTPRARKNHRAEGNRGHDAQINNSGAASAGGALYQMAWTCHVPPVDPRCTWPAITPLARAGAAGDGAGDAGYIAGQCQVHGRPARGIPQVYGRSMGAGRMGLRSPSPPSPGAPAWITTPPRPAPRRLPARADTRTARWMPSTPPMPP